MSNGEPQHVRPYAEFASPYNAIKGLDETLPEQLSIPESEMISFEEYKKLGEDEWEEITKNIHKKYLLLLIKNKHGLWAGKNIKVKMEVWQELAYDFYLRTKCILNTDDIRQFWNSAHVQLRRQLTKSVKKGDNQEETEETLLKDVPLYPYIRFYRRILKEYEDNLREKIQGGTYDQRVIDDVKAFNSEIEVEERQSDSSNSSSSDSSEEIGEDRQRGIAMGQLMREDERRAAAPNPPNSSAAHLVQDDDMDVEPNEEIINDEGNVQMGYYDEHGNYHEGYHNQNGHRENLDNGEPLPTFLPSRPPHPAELRELTYQSVDSNIQLHTAELEEDGEELDEETRIALHALFSELNRYKDGAMYNFSEIFKAAAETAKATEQAMASGRTPPGQ